MLYSPRTVLLLAAMSLSPAVIGQSMSSSKILHELHKLKTVGSVLFVAAHPDDENTALLAYLAQEEKLDTAYLALTRGGGGQNLIGSELKEGLGLIRANELLQARKLDGAKQLFTRARDFGYSKNPEDTLENWQEEKVLGDVVYAVRSFRPDVIITRFNPAAGPTHGHHTVSAQLALKAFTLAADPTQFPEQLEHVDIHQAKRIFWNGYGRRGGGDLKSEKREIIELEIGKYNPYLGTSYTEIAARSRSMHKSQGFGRAGSRGGQLERLVLLAGSPTEGGFLNGVDTTWDRFPGGAKLDAQLKKAISDFDSAAPWGSVSALAKLDGLMDAMPESKLTQSKRGALHRLITASMGIHVQARAENSYLTPGEDVTLQVELVNRSPIGATLSSLEARLFDSDQWPRSIALERIDNLNKSLESDLVEVVELAVSLPVDAPLTQPFWLKTPPDTGIYHFENERLLELENVPAPIEVIAELEIEGRTIPLSVPGIERVSDPIKGEVHKIVAIRPELVLAADSAVTLFEDTQSKRIEVTVTSNLGDQSGSLKATVPNGWTVEIENPEFVLTDRSPSASIGVTVTPPKNGAEGVLSFHAINDKGGRFELGSQLIDYEHIGRQAILSKVQTKLVRLDLKRGGNRIACIVGVGDTVPETLELIGYEIDRIPVGEIDRERLVDYDTVILGPRAFDAHAGLDKRFDELLAYVEAGGTLISQYNTTSFRTKSRFTAPYPIKLSRDRVSEEKVEMRVLQPDHPVFNTPNRIVNDDFDNWIQERGLYYASSWDDSYASLLSANDRGEPARDGGLLVAQYGKGWYAYTGLSFFRQLPEGNAGAIRLFVNLISLGHGN
jgi:LmbE family N-acetylglucosaminyl deacetylase